MRLKHPLRIVLIVLAASVIGLLWINTGHHQVPGWTYCGLPPCPGHEAPIIMNGRYGDSNFVYYFTEFLWTTLGSALLAGALLLYKKLMPRYFPPGHFLIAFLAGVYAVVFSYLVVEPLTGDWLQYLQWNPVQIRQLVAVNAAFLLPAILFIYSIAESLHKKPAFRVLWIILGVIGLIVLVVFAYSFTYRVLYPPVGL